MGQGHVTLLHQHLSSLVTITQWLVAMGDEYEIAQVLASRPANLQHTHTTSSTPLPPIAYPPPLHTVISQLPHQQPSLSIHHQLELSSSGEEEDMPPGADQAGPPPAHTPPPMPISPSCVHPPPFPHARHNATYHKHNHTLPLPVQMIPFDIQSQLAEHPLLAP